MDKVRLPTQYQEFIHLGHYARWVESEKRRETWEETVDRYVNFMFDKQCAGKVPLEVKEEVRKAILNLEVMPSMRCMMTAGKALETDYMSGYNCAFRAITDISAFDEIMYILMVGAGAGFSVERQFIAELPQVADKMHPSKTVIKVEDSRIGWANAYRELVSMLYQGRIPEWDISLVRPAGAKLKIFGGRASGPQPLVDLFKFTIEVFKQAVGRKLTSIECHDIVCKIGEIVVSGGCRRSALMSLSNPSDDRMRHAKSGNWFDITPWRSISNNSMAFTEKPSMDIFIREWVALYESKSGERGIFNRHAAKAQMAKYGRRDTNHEFGLNPCVVGETLVSVADGRLHIPISVLAEEGEDVPVYCYSDDGSIVIRTMKNPRITGYNQPILKVTMDDGSFLRVTANHKFFLTRNVYVQASELKMGDNFETRTVYQSTQRNICEQVSSSNLVVVSVVVDGVATVYNGTVDEFHNFFVGGFESKTEDGKLKFVYVNNKNCGEIFARSCGCCNLSEVVIRAEDKVSDLLRKIRLATIIGTMQATMTNFRYLGPLWKKNAEEEALLGVSLTGIMDNELTSGRKGRKELKEALEKMRLHAVSVNKEWAKILGINQAAAVTTGKPSGCRPWYSLTTTDEGIFTLDELMESHRDGEEWDTYGGNAKAIQNGVDKTKICRTYVNGNKPIMKVKMSYGLEVESTSNHEWFVLERKSGNKRTVVEKFVRTDELRPGDILDVKTGVYTSEVHSPLVKIHRRAISMRGDADNITQPDRMNPDLAWLLGYLWGDGAMSPSKFRLRWTDSRGANLEKAVRIIKEQFDISSEYSQCSDGRKAYYLEVASKMLWHWLIRNDVWKYFRSEQSLDLIPLVVRRSSQEDIIAFIAGMIDADGWCGKNKDGVKYKVMLTTAYPLFASHIQHIGWSVGLTFGRSHNVGGTNFQAKKSMYLLAIGQGANPVAFDMLVRHSGKLGEIKELNSLVSNADLWHSLQCGHNRLIHGRVISVEDAGSVETYDVETLSHWFYAGAVKSHNTISQLTNCSSGIHSRFSKRYVRRVRCDVKDPLAKMMTDMGFPVEPDAWKPDHQVVFSFPISSPDTSIIAGDVSALDQLEIWLIYRNHWCEHNQSCTVYLKDHEWMEVGAWVYKHFDEVSGIAFLPYSHSYQQAPYEECTQKEYDALLSKMPKDVDWSKLSQYESDDDSINHREVVCSGNSCELVDLVKEHKP